VVTNVHSSKYLKGDLSSSSVSLMLSSTANGPNYSGEQAQIRQASARLSIVLSQYRRSWFAPHLSDAHDKWWCGEA